MDLTDAVNWAGRAATPGTNASRKAQAGLRSLFKVTDTVNITNPVSSPRDGTTPDLTSVLLCEVQTQHETQWFCVKLYPPCAEGKTALQKHAMLLSGIRPTVLVPDVVKVLPEPNLFGFSALVTTAAGQTLDQELQGRSAVSCEEIAIGLGRTVAALHSVDPSALPIDLAFDPHDVVNTWQEDVKWYMENADKANQAAGLVRQAASLLAYHDNLPSHACLAHRDLIPHNILVEDSNIILIDWDHAGISAPQEDVAKTLIGLLGMLPLSRSARLPVATAFVDSYSRHTSTSAEEVFLQSLPFALDTLLDWIIGGKNAPSDELSWALEQIIERECI